MGVLIYTSLTLKLKTAEKRLQFGVSKCKSMLITKRPEIALNSPLTVDSWKISHIEKLNSDETQLEEKNEGKMEIEKTECQKYLGFILSSKGDNMINIKNLRNKSI